MPFEFTPRPRPQGDFLSMTDAKAMGEPFLASEVIDDDENMFKGEKKPRFLVKGRFEGSEQDRLVTVPKGYSRDDFLVALQEHLESTDEVTGIRFVATQGSNYIDIVVA